MLFILISAAIAHAYAYAAVDPDADSLSKKGTVCLQAGRYVEALDYFMKGMRKASEAGDTDTYCSCLGNTGTIYGIIGNLDRSLECQTEVYRIATEKKDSLLTAQILVNLFGTYIQKGDVNNARRIFGLQNEHPFPDISLTRHYFLYNQALLAKAQGNRSMAAYYFSKTADHAMASSDTVRLISQLIELGDLFADGTDIKMAALYADSALNLSEKTPLKIKRIDALGLKERVTRASGDTAEAERYLTLRIRQEDSIFGQQQINMINNRLFEYEKQTANIKIDGLEKKVRLQWQTIAYGSVIVCILIISCTLIIINYRRTKAAQKLLIARNFELEQANEQNRLLLASKFDSPCNKKTLEPPVKSEYGELSEEHANRILNDILKVMEDTSVISSQDFSLNTLAKAIGSNTKYVSLAIKQTRGKTFKEFLNEYRIKEACRRLSDPDEYGHVTIEAIYRDLGYSSAGGFIEAFKKINGMTPSRYQKLSRETSGNTKEKQ